MSVLTAQNLTLSMRVFGPRDSAYAVNLTYVDLRKLYFSLLPPIIKLAMIVYFITIHLYFESLKVEILANNIEVTQFRKKDNNNKKGEFELTFKSSHNESTEHVDI